MSLEHPSHQGPERVLLVDLCGTLFDANTTWAFLRSRFVGDAGFQRFDRRGRSFAGRVMNRLLPGDRRRSRAVRFLAGTAREQLVEEAFTFLESVPRIRDVELRVRDLERSHGQVVLLSSSLDFIVEAAAKLLGIPAFEATRLEYVGGICSGRIERDLLGRKQALINTAYAGCSLTMVSDNRSDAACIPRVDRFIGVAHASDRSSINYWSTRAKEVIVYHV